MNVILKLERVELGIKEKKLDITVFLKLKRVEVPKSFLKGVKLFKKINFLEPL